MHRGPGPVWKKCMSAPVKTLSETYIFLSYWAISKHLYTWKYFDPFLLFCLRLWRLLNTSYMKWCAYFSFKLIILYAKLIILMLSIKRTVYDYIHYRINVLYKYKIGINHLYCRNLLKKKKIIWILDSYKIFILGISAKWSCPAMRVFSTKVYRRGLF